MTAIRQILEGLKIGLRQQTTPPYTESNRPQGVFFIDGLDATETALNAYVEEREKRLLFSRMDSDTEYARGFNYAVSLIEAELEEKKHE